jgi:eukaryotic-like serine/threonine-protein kinase
MAELPSPDVTQSQGVSRDVDATRAPDPDATRAPDPAMMGSAHGATTEKLGAPDAGPISGQLKTWGDFQLLQVLGRGGFGEVYRAWDPVLEREVALKLLLPRGMDPELEFTTMVAEARAMAKVHHPNIVPVYGVDRREGRVGFWSEFVRGQTLNALIAAQGVMDEQTAAQTCIALCDALGAVHAAGLLHRDIKPGNAMRDAGGRVLLMDFGLSQNLLAGSGWSGTPAYMAPEVSAGHAASVQSDLYAMGVMLRFLTTGSVAPSAPLPMPLAGIVKRATETDARLRYASAAQMGAELSGLLAAKAEPDKREKKESKEKKDKQPTTFWGYVRKYGIAAIVLAFVFGPQFWKKVHTVTVSAVHPGYQDYLDANEALARYDKPGNTEKAIDLYLAALKSEPNDALAQAGLARAYWRKYEDTSESKWADDANNASSKAMTINANLAQVQATAGMIHAAQGKFDVGMQELQKAVELDPRSADAHGMLANAYRKQGRTEDARKEFQQAMDLDDENWRWPYLMGAMQIETGDFKGAEESLETALKKASENSRVLYNLGLLYLKEARLGEAQKALQKSVDLDPRADPIMALGQVFYRKNDFANAIATYKRATDVAPDQFDSWGNLAEAYAADGKHEAEAAENFKKAAVLAEEEKKRTPDDAYTISMLGKYYASLSEKDRAVPLLRKAIALKPKDTEVAESVAEAYEVMGMRKEALEFLAKALQLGYPVNYAKASPTFKTLRNDPNAPPAIRGVDSVQKDGGTK